MRWSPATEKRNRDKAKRQEKLEHRRRINQIRMKALESPAEPGEPATFVARYQVVARGVGWFDVVGPDGAMNTKALRQEDATTFCEGLNDVDRGRWDRRT
jgi:hypothetical protein